MDFGGLFFLALMWAVFKLVSKSRESPTRPQGRPGLGPLEDPPQEEGRALRMLLKELERAAQRQSGSPGRPPPRRLPPTREVDEAERVESLENAPVRGERVTVDQDEQAEQLVARRTAAALAREAGRAQPSQPRGDQRLGQAAAEQIAPRALTPQQLRDAIVWREILDPPLSERER